MLPSSKILRLANSACRAQDWKTAAEHLAKASKEEQSPERRGRLIWKRIEYLFAGGERVSARRALQSAINEFPPQTPEQWCLAVRLYPRDANPQFILNTVVEGLKRHPSSTELVLHLERLCKQTGRWQAARSIVDDLLAEATDDQQYCRILRVKCGAAIHLRDAALIEATAREIVENIHRISLSHDYLRFYAATAGCASLRAEDTDRLLHHFRNREMEGRIHIAAGWAALMAGNWKRVGKSITSFEQTGTGLPNGTTWKKIVTKLYSCLSDWRVAAHLGFPELAYDHLRSHLREARSPATFLHAFALANMSLAQRKLSQGLSDSADSSLCVGLGSWVAFLQNESALQSFIAARWRCYGIQRKAPEIKVIVRELEACLIVAVECHPDPDRLKLLWDLEKKAVTQVANLGGLRLPDNSLMAAGPFLSNSLGLHRAVRALSNEGIRLLFSSLGPVAIFLDRHQFEMAARELDRIAESVEQRDSRREDFQQLLVQCHLDASQDLVAQVPVDISLVRRGWEWAVNAARAIGTEEQAQKSIVQIAMGRGSVLFERRTVERRQVDPDKRSLPVRRQEAIELETLAWELTKDMEVRTVLINHLHRDALGLFKRSKFDESADRIFAALGLKPNAPYMAEHLARILRARRRYKLEQDLYDEAGASLVEGIQRLRDLDPNSDVEEIQKALAELEKLGPVPFVERSLSAMEGGSWKLATDLMVWALQVCSKNEFVREGSYNLHRELSLSVEQGSNHGLEVYLVRLKEHLPEDIFEVNADD